MSQKVGRRIIFEHTEGVFKGLRQIVGVQREKDIVYTHTEPYMVRTHEGPLPDVLASIPMTPDGRWSRGMRLKTTDRYALYQELPYKEE